MKKRILKFRDIVAQMDGTEIGNSTGQIIVSVTNLDDLFRAIRKNGIKEVRVDIGDMIDITRFCVANARMFYADKEICWKVLHLLQEGKINKFLGVKLILEEEYERIGNAKILL